MDNVLIEINKKTRQVFLTNSVIGNDGENLQENLVFSFNDEFVDGTGRLELIKPDKEKSYIMLEKIDETYQIPVKSIITKGGRLTMQLVITQGTDPNAIPIFKSNKFYVVVNSSINFLIEEPDEYPQWIDVANTKLNEIDEAILEASNLNIDVNKEDNVATITLTDKEGQTKEVQILDGQDGEQGPQGIQGETGPAGADGIDGQDATINGVNTINIEAGENISINQSGSTLTINSTGGGAVSSVNGQTGDVVIDIPDITGLGHSIAMSIDSSTYVLTVSLKNSVGTVLNTQTVDLPLETMVVGGSYDSTNKKIILTLNNGQTIDIPVSDLVSGLQSEITSSNKLSADLVDDTNTTNKFTNATEKTTWNGKYDKPSGGIPSTDLSSAVQTSLGKADTAIQDISGKQDIIQYSTMPTATSETVGKIVQYTGTTTNDYTNGYFYIGIDTSGVYSWERIDVQPSGDSSTIDIINNCMSNTYPLDVKNLEKGLYFLTDISNYNTKIYIKLPSGTTLNSITYDTYIMAIIITKSPSEWSGDNSNGVFGYILGSGQYSGELMTRKLSTNGRNITVGTEIYTNFNKFKGITNEAQSFVGEKTFGTTPKVNSYTAPTLNTQLTAKKYVDDSISTVVGNINTVLATLTTPSNNGGGE